MPGSYRDGSQQNVPFTLGGGVQGVIALERPELVLAHVGIDLAAGDEVEALRSSAADPGHDDPLSFAQIFELTPMGQEAAGSRPAYQPRSETRETVSG